MVQINLIVSSNFDRSEYSTCISAHSFEELRCKIVEFQTGVNNLMGYKQWRFKRCELFQHDIIGKTWAILLGLIENKNYQNNLHEKK